MTEFWQWIIDKGYGGKVGKNYFIYINDVAVIPDKAALIPLMEAYLKKEDYKLYAINKYKELEWRIEG